MTNNEERRCRERRQRAISMSGGAEYWGELKEIEREKDKQDKLERSNNSLLEKKQRESERLFFLRHKEFLKKDKGTKKRRK